MNAACICVVLVKLEEGYHSPTQGFIYSHTTAHKNRIGENGSNT